MRTTINIDVNKKMNQISPLLYGVFFEDINYGGDGGLYGELIANRSFENFDRNNKADKHKMCWESFGDISFDIQNDKPINKIHTYYAHIAGYKNTGIRNLGYCGEGIGVRDGDILDFSCYIRSKKDGVLLLRITDFNREYGASTIDFKQGEWIKYNTEIKIEGDSRSAYVEIMLMENSEIDIEFISLFNHNTFCGRANGLRCDLAEMVADISPRFVRFPGGCIVEGRSIDNMYNWKDTIGSVEERRTQWNRWHMEEYQQKDNDASDYFQSYGLGFYEYFQFCEDIGAKPIPVINCGMTCQWHESILIDINELDSWIQDALDLIEFANGNKESKWGKIRAKMGHEAPFNLEYLAIGNEQWGEEYFIRYEMFYKAISQKYPEVKIITSAGWTSDGTDFDLAMDWMKKNSEKAYAVDEHFYKTQEWFLENISRYDKYNRNLPKVLIGEYAAHTSKEISERKNSFYAALCEAAFLTGVENNSDHVIMTCYAPLFGRIEHNQWQPNMIWFDNTKAYATPNYYVQKLFSNNMGDYIVEGVCDDETVKITASISSNKKLIIKLVNISDKEKEINLNFNSQALGGVHYEFCCESGKEHENYMKSGAVITENKLEIKNPIFIKGLSVNVLSLELC